MILSSSFRQSIHSIIKDGKEHTCITTQKNDRKPIRKCITRRLRKKSKRRGKGSRKRRKKIKRRRKRRRRRRTRQRGGKKLKRKSRRRRRQRGGMFPTDLTWDPDTLLAPGEYTRVIDGHIHSLGGRNEHGQTFHDPAESLQHQEKIITFLRNNPGSAVAIFNDPNFDYNVSGRQQVGITGAMSSILTSGFYILYAQLLQQGLQVNFEADAETLFMTFLGIRMRSDGGILTFDIPEVEMEAIKYILVRIIPNQNVVTPQLLESYKTAFTETLNGANEKWQYWNTRPDQQTIHALIGWTHSRGALNQLYDANPWMRNMVPWENTPEYYMERAVFGNPEVIAQGQFPPRLDTIRNLFWPNLTNNIL